MQRLWTFGVLIAAVVAIFSLPSKTDAFALEKETVPEGGVRVGEGGDDTNSTVFDGARLSDGRCLTLTCCTVPIPPITTPNLPSITFATNCDYCDHELYTLTCIPDAFTCATLCANDRKCTHFTYIAKLNGGTCRLKTAPGSGGAWASMIPAPSQYICGYIPKRAFTNILLNICVGLDISLFALVNL